MGSPTISVCALSRFWLSVLLCDWESTISGCGSLRFVYTFSTDELRESSQQYCFGTPRKPTDSVSVLVMSHHPKSHFTIAPIGAMRFPPSTFRDTPPKEIAFNVSGSNASLLATTISVAVESNLPQSLPRDRRVILSGHEHSGKYPGIDAVFSALRKQRPPYSPQLFYKYQIQMGDGTDCG